MKRLSEIDKNRAEIIVRQHGGIYRPYEAFYIHSIQYAAERSDTAFAQFRMALSNRDSPDAIFAAFQEALIHAGALSRFFWPAKSAGDLAQARGKRLQKAFKLDRDSPLIARELRNALEHFDERLDLFLLRDPVGYFFPSPVVESHQLSEDAFGNIFKLVDPEHGLCVLLGERFEFLPIEQEVGRVYALAQQFRKNGGVLPA